MKEIQSAFFTHPFTFIGMQWVLFSYSCLWSPNLIFLVYFVYYVLLLVNIEL